MARFVFDEYDFEAISVNLNEYANIGEDMRGWLIEKIVTAGAEVLKECYQTYLKKQHFITGKLAESIKIEYLKNLRVALVGPRGIHHGRKTSTKGTHRSKTGQGKSYYRKHHGMAKGVTAQEVGYFLEYGTPRIQATHWMENANEEAKERVFAAEDAIIDEYLAAYNKN